MTSPGRAWWETVSRIAAGASCLVGLAILAGWLFQVPILALATPGSGVIHATTVLALLAGGVSLWLPGGDRARALGLWAGSLAILVSVLGLAGLGLGARGGRDVGGWLDLALQSTPGIDRMGLGASVTLVLLGLALLGARAEGPRSVRAAEIAGLAALSVPLVTLLGYLYGVRPLGGLGPGGATTCLACVGLLILTVGTLLRLRQGPVMATLLGDGVGSVMARRLLTAVILVPIGVGWLQLAGQRLGHYGAEVGVVLLVVATLGFLTVAVLGNAVALNRLDKERQKALAGRATSDILYRTIVEATPECVKIVAPDGTLLDMNPAGIRMIEADHRDQVIGRSIHGLIAPEYLESFKTLHKRICAGGEGTLDFEIQSLKGRRRFMETHSVPLRDQNGRILGAVGVTRDVTGMKRMEEQFRQAQKMEAIGRLAGGVAHDFNNLLTVILGSLGLALSRPASHPHARETLDEARRAAERAAVLTRQLLAFSRQQVMTPQVIDANGIVSNMEKMLRRLIGEDITLKVTMGARLGTIRADPGQLEQVIANLVVNARDAMPRGGSLAIETGVVVLDEARAEGPEVVPPGSYVQLSVTDTGAGMDDGTMARIFEPFFTTKEQGKGTGLGLATVYGIVKQSGGHIGVSSRLGHGTTFRICFPRLEAAAETPRPAAGAEPGPRGSGTILVVEDDEAVRVLTGTILKSHGFRVLSAANGKEALRLAEIHPGPIALMVTDVIMPEMSGREVAERVGRLRPGIPVLYVSGYTDDAVIRHGGLEPGVDFLQKPLRRETLLGKVAAILRPGGAAANGGPATADGSAADDDGEPATGTGGP